MSDDGKRDWMFCRDIQLQSHGYFDCADRKDAENVGGQMCVGESLTVLFRFRQVNIHKSRDIQYIEICRIVRNVL